MGYFIERKEKGVFSSPLKKFNSIAPALNHMVLVRASIDGITVMRGNVEEGVRTPASPLSTHSHGN